MDAHLIILGARRRPSSIDHPRTQPAPPRSTADIPPGVRRYCPNTLRRGTNMMSEQLLKEGPPLPTDDRTLARSRRAIELGELEQLSTVPGIPNTPRYLVTYMNSQTRRQRHAFGHGYIGDQPERVDQPRVRDVFSKASRTTGRRWAWAVFAIPPQFTVDCASPVADCSQRLTPSGSFGVCLSSNLPLRLLRQPYSANPKGQMMTWGIQSSSTRAGQSVRLSFSPMASRRIVAIVSSRAADNLRGFAQP